MSQDLKHFAVQCLRKLRDAKFEAYFAGGCVRDLLLGIEPKDYDIATDAFPKDIQNLFPRTVQVGEAFNVILVLSDHEENPFRIEVASFRKDIGIADGRHPQTVEPASAKEDVLRRDFTINGMFYDPIEDKVLDWVGGQNDLKSRIIRAIGEPDQRIQEDHLRMLRAIRFTARFEYEMDKNLWQAIQRMAPLIKKISAERVFEELTKMLTEGSADRAFQLLYDSKLLNETLPEIVAMRGVEQPPEYHPEGDVWVHTLLLLKQLHPFHSKELAWGCLLHDVGKPPTFSHEPPDRIRFNRHAQVGRDMADNILKRLRASNHFREVVCELVNDHLKFADVKNMRPATLKRFLRNPNFTLHLELHRIDCLASHQNLELYEFCKAELVRIKEEDLRPKALISGNDLIKLGFKPGPVFKEILAAVETEQLEDRIHSKDEALKYVKKFFEASQHEP